MPLSLVFAQTFGPAGLPLSQHTIVRFTSLLLRAHTHARPYTSSRLPQYTKDSQIQLSPPTRILSHPSLHDRATISFVFMVTIVLNRRIFWSAFIIPTARFPCFGFFVCFVFGKGRMVLYLAAGGIIGIIRFSYMYFESVGRYIRASGEEDFTRDSMEVCSFSFTESRLAVQPREAPFDIMLPSLSLMHLYCILRVSRHGQDALSFQTSSSASPPKAPRLPCLRTRAQDEELSALPHHTTDACCNTGP